MVILWSISEIVFLLHKIWALWIIHFVYAYKWFLHILIFLKIFEDCKEHGNTCLANEDESNALYWYQLAIDLGNQHKTVKECATIHEKCGDDCPDLKFYYEAYQYSCKCINLSPENYQGYFLRAEALKALIDQDGKRRLGTSHVDVVKDYLKSHSIQANVKVYCQAIYVAVGHGKNNYQIIVCMHVEDNRGIGGLILTLISDQIYILIRF